MINYLKSIATDIQERYRNPLIGSFLLSWLIFNWQITFLAINFVTDSKSSLKFDDFIKKVHLLSNNCNSLIFPLLAALFYVVIFPFFRIGIGFLQAWFARHLSDFELKGSKGGSVSINKYISLRNEYLIRIEELKTLINSEDKNRYIISDLENSLREREKTEREFKNRKYPNLLNKFWKITLRNSIDPTAEPTIILPNGNKAFFKVDAIELTFKDIKLYRKDSSEIVFQGEIKYFDYDRENEIVFMYCEFANLSEEDNDPGYLIFNLKAYKNTTIMEGNINNLLDIEMTILNNISL